MAGMVTFFRGTSYELDPAVWGAVDPTSTCASDSCADGAVSYYPEATTDTPHSSTPLEAMGSLKGSDCTQGSMCFCLTTGECFTSSNANSISLWPFNGMVYAFIGDFGTMFTGDMGTVLDGANYFDPNTGNPLPVTDQNTVLSSLGCGACPPITTCN
ncbi:hypothetical protein FO519_005411 [Halicephalobus sp. NKZ332]|nr:hypothetical protein FO519_005411 [Halicephalobus sp. NKZ332]